MIGRSPKVSLRRRVALAARIARDLLLETALPASCPVCDGPLASPRGGVCRHCWDDVARAAYPAAGSGVGTSGRFLASFTALGPYEGRLKGIIRCLKFGDLPSLGRPLAEGLAERLAARAGAFDLVVPVPLHPWRRWERGYNQAEAIGRELGRLMGAPLAARAIRRVRATAPQRGRSRRQRLANVRGAFSARVGWGRPAARMELRQAAVLLVDDVVTTGATLRECARALRAAGAASVHGAAAARTPGPINIRGEESR